MDISYIALMPAYTGLIEDRKMYNGLEYLKETFDYRRYRDDFLKAVASL
jgi:hypothetical protein